MAKGKKRHAHALLAGCLATTVALASSVSRAPIAHAETTSATTEITVECRDPDVRDRATSESAQIRRTERGRIPATADATAAGIDAAILVAITALIVGVASRDGPHEGEEDAMNAAKD